MSEAVSSIYVDINTGKLAVGTLAIQELIEAATYDAKPLADVLTAQEFPYKKSNFESSLQFDADPELAVQMGRWIFREPLAAGTILTSKHIKRAHVLGLLPKYETLLEAHKGVVNFILKCSQDTIEADTTCPKNAYDHATALSMIVEAYKDSKHYGPLTKKQVDYLSGRPSSKGDWSALTQFTDLSVVNEHLGYPNFENWTYKDFVRYGVDIMDHNGGKPITASMLEYLAGKFLWPEDVISELDLNEYQKATQKEYDQSYALLKDLADFTATDEYDVRRHFIRPLNDDSRQLLARYRLVLACHPTLSPQYVLELSVNPTAKLLHTLLLSRHITKKGIVQTAARLGITETIWPTGRLRPNLRVPQLDNEPPKIKKNRYLSSLRTPKLT